MQSFKQIPFQNYIELKFNDKNLSEARYQEAMIAYKRNAQILGQIFVSKRSEQHDEGTVGNQSQTFEDDINSIRAATRRQEEDTDNKINNINQRTSKFERLMDKARRTRTPEDVQQLVEELKANDMYDDKHPVFVADSPFYMRKIDQDVMEVAEPVGFNDEGMNFLEIN